MPDITMCTGKCPLSDECYRYMAEPNPYGQTYSALESVCIPNGYSEFIEYKRNSISDLKDFIMYEINKNKTN